MHAKHAVDRDLIVTWLLNNVQLEGELYNGRVAMLAVVGILTVEALGRGPWWQAYNTVSRSMVLVVAGLFTKLMFLLADCCTALLYLFAQLTSVRIRTASISCQICRTPIDSKCCILPHHHL